MATNRPNNLETDFEKLHLVSETYKNMKENTEFSKHSTSKEKSRLGTIRVAPFACLKNSFNGKKTASRSVLRPAKLRVLSLSKKSVLIRPSKLKVKEPKTPILKPATLILQDKCKPLKSSKFSVPSTSLPNVPFSVGQVFSDDKLKGQHSFKSLITNEDSEISNAFDALSFKKLRYAKPTPTSEISVANKCESTSSCSAQARMESNAPVDCDDTSTEELASYFDLFVHIPKKMSSMAEMMYI